jgi:hypothetical protein
MSCMGRILWKHPTPQALPYTKTLVSSIHKQTNTHTHTHTHTHTFCSQSVCLRRLASRLCLWLRFSFFIRSVAWMGLPRRKIDSTKETPNLITKESLKAKLPSWKSWTLCSFSFKAIYSLHFVNNCLPNWKHIPSII